jgi:hypothetical protein
MLYLFQKGGKKMNTKYYKVTCHRAHQGRGKSVPISFYIEADNVLHASRKAQRMAGVKHSKFIISCIPVSIEEYFEGRKTSAYYRGGF